MSKKQTLRQQLSETTRLAKWQRNEILNLEERITHLGNSLAQATSLVQTQDGEIGRLTTLNDRMFKIIDKMITQEQTQCPPYPTTSLTTSPSS